MVEAFLESQGMPVELFEVEQALEKLWGPAAEKAGGPDLDHPTMTRVVLANVVLVCLGPDRPGLAETISAITTQYPSRLILIRPDGSGGRKLSAEVSAQCHLPAPGRPQICSEQIILRCGPESFSLVPGAVRSLVESDLHSVLWWCDDPRSAPEFFEELAVEATRVILDLPDPEIAPAALVAAVDSDRRMLMRDAAWFGLTPWRGMIADVIQRTTDRGFPEFSSLRIRAIANSPDRLPRAAAWLASWFAGQLGWKPSESSRRSSPGRFEAIMTSNSREVPILFEVEQCEAAVSARIVEVEIGMETTGEPRKILRLCCDGNETCEARVMEVGGTDPRMPRLIRGIRDEPSKRVSAAFLTDRVDPPYRNALPVVLWLLGAKSQM